MAKHVMGFFTTLCFMVMIFATGFGVCTIPKTTEVLATYTDVETAKTSPFSVDELVEAAMAGTDYTFYSNDYAKLMDVIQRINIQEETPYAGLSIVELANAPYQYTLTTDAISHLDDCFKVANAARAIIVVIAVAGIILAIVMCAKGRDYRLVLSRALKASAILLAVGLVVLGAYAAVDFDAFFTVFHSLFFEDGTWTFYADSLLISMYPENFWVGMGIIWLVSSLIAGILTFALGSAIKPRKA